MIILGIETSCDETAISLIDTAKEGQNLTFKILGNELISQAKIHEQYGGVFPVIAKREHGKNLIPLFLKIIEKSALASDHKSKTGNKISESKVQAIESILIRETELKELFLKTLLDFPKPSIDKIAVTAGPGLEPALWVGICFAKALGELWDIPVIPVNHMEGHIFSALISGVENSKFDILNSTFYILPIRFPALALLISGGHTELILMKEWRKYEIIGKTRDDAVGEAFDKVARILGLPYPGGPQISLLAEQARISNIEYPNPIHLPRPMIHSKDLDFSFSGLKTAVLYLKKKLGDLSLEMKQEISKEFEDAITEVLIKKTEAAMEEYGVQTLLLGGGVIANTHIRKSFIELGEKRDVSVRIPTVDLSTDNALMIALAGAVDQNIPDTATIIAQGNLKLE